LQNNAVPKNTFKTRYLFGTVNFRPELQQSQNNLKDKNDWRLESLEIHTLNLNLFSYQLCKTWVFFQVLYNTVSQLQKKINQHYNYDTWNSKTYCTRDGFRSRMRTSKRQNGVAHPYMGTPRHLMSASSI
jgi:hypothetical protein